MTSEFSMLSLAILVILTLSILLFLKSRNHRAGQSAEWRQALESLRGEIALSRNSLSGEIHTQSNEHIRFLQATRSDYQTTMGGVENRLGQLQQATSQMIGMAKDLSSLQNILQHPKLRGGMGEFLLEELLSQVLPQESYGLQYGFSDGVKADAVLKLGDALISIDSKFPLENFQRLLAAEEEGEQRQFRRLFVQDVKKHCDDIAAKYIRPAEGTLDFALMFIPAEYVYYEAFLAPKEEVRSLQEYVLKKKVLAVSPQGFYAYLQIVARGLKGLRIEKAAQEILSHINQLELDLTKALTEFEKVGTHLKNAQTAYDRNLRQWLGLKDDLTALSAIKNSSADAEGLIQTAEIKL